MLWVKLIVTIIFLVVGYLLLTWVLFRFFVLMVYLQIGFSLWFFYASGKTCYNSAFLDVGIFLATLHLRLGFFLYWCSLQCHNSSWFVFGSSFLALLPSSVLMVPSHCNNNSLCRQYFFFGFFQARVKMKNILFYLFQY